MISLLSGSVYDTDHTIRAAAVRALAIYVMFPSMREDMCYVENTSEAIIRALQDGNMEVRVRTSWSLGIVSDALLANRFVITIK